MNFLAHIYLSGDSESVRIGNFIGDWIKGKAYQQYPLEVQKGILLHRAIDDFTDKHPVTRAWAKRLKSHYHKYAGVVVDILYDHFLSVRWNEFTNEPLHVFINEAYETMREHLDLLPREAEYGLNQMMLQKRLESYVRIEGIYNALKTMSVYTSLPPYPEFAIDVLKQHYGRFLTDFMTFMDDIMAFIRNTYHIAELKNFREKSIAS